MFTPKSIICLREYNRETFTKDLFAGITVGVVALPLAMAFAIASGLPPERGLFTAVVAGFLISALGGSRVQIGGPTGAFVILVGTVAAQYGYNGLVIATLLAGALLVVMGLARFGAMIKFIPYPVVTGFTAGIAVVIFSTQIRDFFGLKLDEVPIEFFEKWALYFRNLDTVNFYAFGVGLGTILLILLLRRISPRIPGMLLSLIVAAVVTSFWDLPIETIGSRFGDLPRVLPAPSFPTLDWGTIRELISPAFTIALLAGIESLLSATVADGMMGTRHKSNMELIAQGTANIGSAIFGGIPATGAIARTATNVKSGGRTPMAGIIHAVTLLIIMIAFAPQAKYIPLAALSGILMIVSYNMSEIDQFRSLLRAPRSDVVVLLSTFALTVVIDLTIAVQVGVVMAALLFIRRMSEVASVGVVTREFQDSEEKPDPNAIGKRRVPPGVEVFEINGPFFFGAAETFRDTLRALRTKPKVLIVRMRQVPVIDATGLHLLEELHSQCRRDGTKVVFSGVHAQPLFALQRTELFEHIGAENVFGNIDDALNRAREILGLPIEETRPEFVPEVARERIQKPE
jgi:SulP family sulfate permease